MGRFRTIRESLPLGLRPVGPSLVSLEAVSDCKRPWSALTPIYPAQGRENESQPGYHLPAAGRSTLSVIVGVNYVAHVELLDVLGKAGLAPASDPRYDFGMA